MKAWLFHFIAVSMQVSSYIDAESSDDDDLYCDSINPDQVCENSMLI